MTNFFVNKDMQSIPKSVLAAVEHKCYLAALALALTIPDVYGRIEYPPRAATKDGVHIFMRNGRKLEEPYMKYPSTLSHYQKWFDHYVHDYPSFARSEDISSDPKNLTGYFCYLLRCKVLHESTHDIKPNSNRPVDFRLRLSHASDKYPADSFGTLERNGELTYQITIDPVHLSQALARAALLYEEKITGEQDHEKLRRLEKHRLGVDDLDEFISFMAT